MKSAKSAKSVHLWLATFAVLALPMLRAAVFCWGLGGLGRGRPLAVRRLPLLLFPAAAKADGQTASFCTSSASNLGKTTNAEDQEKAKQIRAETDATTISASAKDLETLPEVIIDEGTFKYVLLRASVTSGEQKYLVRGTVGAEYHRDVAIPYVRAYLKDGFGIEVLGGGRILHDVQRGFLKIYGFSYGFPWVDGAGHEISAEVCARYFSGYEVTWTDDGY